MKYKYVFNPRVKMNVAFEGFWIWLANRNMPRISFEDVTITDHIECYLSGDENNQLYRQYILLMGLTMKVDTQKVG